MKLCGGPAQSLFEGGKQGCRNDTNFLSVHRHIKFQACPLLNRRYWQSPVNVFAQSGHMHAHAAGFTGWHDAWLEVFLSRAFESETLAARASRVQAAHDYSNSSNSVAESTRSRHGSGQSRDRGRDLVAPRERTKGLSNKYAPPTSIP